LKTIGEGYSLKASINHYASEVRHKTTVKASNTIRLERLFIYINKSRKLTIASTLDRAKVGRETRSGIIKRIDEE
jgi:hypothetical protein